MRDGMDNSITDWEAGMTAPADGNAGADARGIPHSADSVRSDGQQNQVSQGMDLGPNFERLEEERPELVNALRELVWQYRQEGVTAWRHEIRRIRQARLFWQGLQCAWWNPNDINWHLPFEQKFNDDRALEEMPRYQFVTNFYQVFGLSFVAVLSQDVPSEMTDQQLAQTNAMNRVARTGNSAGFADLTDELAREKGRQEANTAQQNQVNFSNTAYQRQMAALQGLSGLYGVDTNLLGRTLGIPASLLNTRANASRPSGFFSSLGSSLVGTLGGLPSLFV